MKISSGRFTHALRGSLKFEAIEAGCKIMEIIREGPSASRPPILDDGVLVLKPEVDWTNAEEQASVGNVKALNAISNGVDLNVFKLINSCSTAKDTWRILKVAYEGTSKVKISRLQLITSKFEALKMSEDKLMPEYNERVLEIANESLLLEEAHDITTLKLDELFGSLLTFEMAISDRENKKYGENTTRRNNEVSNRRGNDYGKKKEGECGGVGHYLAECPRSLRRQKKNFRATLSNEDIDDSKDESGMNAFEACIIEIDFGDKSECFEENCDEELTFEELKVL
ncbi:gag-pol polyprotein [Cucumis melo var. makuwa]|uniref:Gag-pol polyprotein n=1 Tax=Cucumis melo var. makuwa TaxID=1194695 RepID=A0A5D3DQN3_CUCMM|nr:gag-pol polyprotein [Cucumis melo var. makuwa]